MGPNPITFPESRWTDLFPAQTLRKAKALAQGGAVGALEWQPDCDALIATVRSGPGSRHEVEIDFQDEEGEWQVEYTECDCAKTFDCVHAAAVLYAVSGCDSGKPDARKSARTSGLPAPLRFWLDAMHAAASSPSTPAEPAESQDRILYVLQGSSKDSPSVSELSFQSIRSRKKRDGTNGSPAPYNLYNSIERPSAVFVQSADTEIARRLFLLIPEKYAMTSGSVVLTGRGTLDFLTAVLATGRCHWADHRSPPLRPGPTRPGAPQWRRTASGQLRTCIETTPPAGKILALETPWYIDVATSECGPIETPLAPAVASVWLGAPALDPLDAASHVPAITKEFQPLALPPPPAAPVRREPLAPPVPSLHLATVNVPWWEAPWGFQRSGGGPLPVLAAKASFWYGANEVAVDQPGSEIRLYDGQELVLIPRVHSFEKEAFEKLKSLGLVPARKAFQIASDPRLKTAWTLQDHSDAATLDFVTRVVPALRAAGWKIERDPGFALEVCQPTEWYVETLQEGADDRNDWFGLELGVRVGDEKINLLPVLLQGLQGDLETFRPEFLKKRGPKESVLILLPDGRRIPFPAGRLHEILTALVELHSGNALGESGRLKVHRLRAAQLGELSDAPQWVWAGDEYLRDLSKRLRRMDKLPEAEAPSGLKASLRPYQLDGLRWLQFIREFQLGGVLADDMGLGKTIQTLAHLLLEKEEGRLDRPALVVSPTSVLVNWRDEVARFAPNLRVVTLHGGTRHAFFGEIQGADVVLTTYALLPRDSEVLLKADFHCVILDEAQNIKNPKTLAAQVVCQLKARHRLCLSGTPIENHLGELWSLFNFAIPGFLSDETRFRAVYRQPIEKENDPARRAHLARRVRPFLLRRRKDEVARDLPEKTEIVRKVELAGRQRDLYETIRLAMESRVRDEVEKKGVNRSQIIILDALLKLRQVCCDPRLVPLEAARQVAESAKLDHVMELIPTLLEDGRRILLFSQFTSMLELIQRRLEDSRIPWLLLTGDTTDRATPVRRFQAKEIPLFLLSLKAGGSGLNLTAADTVILFDPWWNPAVEAQATDRAHRIGQDKPVFVYRLIAAGTVEEKMAELQVRKRELVQALLEEGSSGSHQLKKEDIDFLFAPLG